MKSDALCIWAGSDCTFNQMIAAVDKISADETTRVYQFGLQGMLAQLPERVTPNLRTTITMLETSVVIYNATIDSGGELESSFRQVFQGFDRPTWFVMFAIYFGLVAVGYIISVAYRRTFSPFVALMHLQGAEGPLFAKERSDKDNDIDMDRENIGGTSKEYTGQSVMPTVRKMHELSVALLYSSFFIMGVIVVVFYELGLVNFIFNQTEEKLPKPFRLYSDAELSRFSVLEGSSPEFALRNAVDPYGLKYRNESLYPWHRCKSEGDCFKKVLDRKDKVCVVLSVQSNARYHINKKGLCRKLIKLETDEPLLKFSGGWYISSSVPHKKLVAINQGILIKKSTGRIMRIIDQEMGKGGDNCGKRKLAVGPLALSIPLLVVTGPLTIILLSILIASFCIPTVGKDQNMNDDYEALAPLESTAFSKLASGV